MKSTDNDKPSSRTRRPNHTGSLHKSKNHYVARVMYHGTKHEWSTGIRIDMKDERGRPCGREMAQKVLDGMTEPFRHEQEEFVTAIMLSKMKMAHEAADRAKASSGMLIVKNLGKEFAKSTRRNDITERHLKAYLACVSEFAEYIGGARLASSITAKDAVQWADAIWEKGIAAHTFNGKISQMRQIWKVLSPKIGDGENPWDGIKKKKKDTHQRRAITEQELAAILAAAEDRYFGDARMLIEIGANTGMRIGDCSTLKWSDVDFETGFIRTTTTKTGAKVAIPLLARFKDALLQHKKRQEAAYSAAEKSGDWNGWWRKLDAKNAKAREMNTMQKEYMEYVCPRMAERQLRDRTLVSILMRKTFERAGVTVSEKVGKSIRARPVTGFHSLRHTFVSRLRMAGVSLEAAKTIVGHRSTTINEHYTHIDENYLAAEMRKLDAPHHGD